MCGITGLISLDTENPERLISIVDALIPSVAARGPDGRGIVHASVAKMQAVFAHTRLSIIDASLHGSQPMQDDASNWFITYNGEIYNYLEIRDELRRLGWSFHGGSDTEVLLKAWIQWGLAALPRLNGMFAFAVLNRRTGQTWLVRDRFGVKPLLWGRTPEGRLVFSSSVSAVAKLIGAEVNIDHCAHGLRYKAFEVPGSESPFKGVQSVSAGGWLQIDTSIGRLDVSEGRWYDLKQAVANKLAVIETKTDEDLLQKCHYLLNDAIQIRLRSDAPLAVSLSGGVDSSAIAAIASRHVFGLNGFTYGSPHAARSEGPIVAEFAAKVGIKVQYIWPQHDEAGLDSLLERVLRCQEAPFPGLSVLAQNEVFNAVRQSGFKVLLGGQGGDECFAGYRKFFVVATRDAINRRAVGEAACMLYSLGLMLLNEAGQAGRYWQAMGRYRSKPEFSFNLLDWQPPSINLWGNSWGTLSDRQIDDIQQWSIPSLLRYEDRNSMGNGVESRLPFMDYRLVELALALPNRMKILNGYGKWALRSIIDGVVPNLIRLNRKKRGFDVTQTWIEDGVGASLRARIQDNKSALGVYLKRNLNYAVLLSDEALKRNNNLLDEALMLAWLTEPVRPPVVTGGMP